MTGAEELTRSALKLTPSTTKGSGDLTNRVLELGPPPHQVVITVTIDGDDMVGQAITWPDDCPSNSDESVRVPLQSESE